MIPMQKGQPMAVPPKLPDSALRVPQPSPPPPLVRRQSQESNIAHAASRASLPLTPEQRARRRVIATAITIVSIALCAFGYENWCTPKHSILNLAAAVDRRDRETITEYVDAPALAGSYHRLLVELYNSESARTSTNFVDHLFQPLFSEMADGIAGATYTPESMIDMLCGESPKDALKKGVGDAADNTVDTFTKDGTPKTKLYGAGVKVLARCVAGYAIDKAASDSAGKQPEFNPADYVFTTQYESFNRYLIKLTPRHSDGPVVGYVFERHGLGTWKWSELRLILQKTKQTAAVH